MRAKYIAYTIIIAILCLSLAPVVTQYVNFASGGSTDTARTNCGYLMVNGQLVIPGSGSEGLNQVLTISPNTNQNINFGLSSAYSSYQYLNYLGLNNDSAGVMVLGDSIGNNFNLSEKAGAYAVELTSETDASEILIRGPLRVLKINDTSLFASTQSGNNFTFTTSPNNSPYLSLTDNIHNNITYGTNIIGATTAYLFITDNGGRYDSITANNGIKTSSPNFVLNNNNIYGSSTSIVNDTFQDGLSGQLAFLWQVSDSIEMLRAQLIGAQTILTGQTTSLSSALVYTVIATDNFLISGHVTTTAGTTGVVASSVTYTDENNNSGTFPMGTTAGTGILPFYFSGVGASQPVSISAHAGTVITISTTVTGTAFYSIGATILKI